MAGEERLNKVFWVYQFLYPLVVALVFTIVTMVAIFAGVLKNMQSLHFAWWTVMLTTVAQAFVIIPYCLWCNISVWRCAFNCNKKAWGYLARAFTVLVWFQVIDDVMVIINAPKILMADTMEPLAGSLCEHEMKKIAERMFEDPQKYIKDNSLYLQQCIQRKLNEETPASKKP